MKNSIKYILLTFVMIILTFSGCRPIEDIGRSRSDCIKKYEKKYCDARTVTFEKYSLKENYETETDVHQEILNLLLWEEKYRDDINSKSDADRELWNSLNFLDLTDEEIDGVRDYLDERKEQNYTELKSATNDYLKQILDRTTSISKTEKEKLYNAYKDATDHRLYSDSEKLLSMYQWSLDDYGELIVLSNVDITKKKNKDGTYTYSAAMSTKTMSLLFPDYMEKAATCNIRDNLSYKKKSDLNEFIEDFNLAVDYITYAGKQDKYSKEIAACKKSIEKNRELINKGYYESDEYKRVEQRMKEKYGNNTNQNSSFDTSSGYSKSKDIDPSDYDVEAYYEDNSDIYDSYDDAEDGFLDEDSETQKYYK